MSRDGDGTNMEMRAFHCELANEVMAVHRSRCPCCTKVMVVPRRNNPANSRRKDLRTVAHDRPRGFGGDPTIWVYTCQQCNHDQRARPFRIWAIALDHQQDERAARVAALAALVEDFMARSKVNVRIPIPTEAAE